MGHCYQQMEVRVGWSGQESLCWKNIHFLSFPELRAVWKKKILPVHTHPGTIHPVSPLWILNWGLALCLPLLPSFASVSKLEPAGWVPDSTLYSSSRKELLKQGSQGSRRISEHTHTYTWLLRASCWHGTLQKHTKVSVWFKFIFNHMKSNLENGSPGCCESPRSSLEDWMHREGRNLSWHGPCFTTRIKMSSFLSLEWRSFKI